MLTKKNIPQRILAMIKNNPIPIMLAAVSIIMGFTIPNFFSLRNFNNLASNVSVRLLIALGISGCLITKGTDLSACRQVGLAACIGGVLLQRVDYPGRVLPNLPDMNMWMVLLICIVIGAFIGMINGFVISKLNVPPFIATLGTQTIIYGIALIFTDAQPIGGFKSEYGNFVNGLLFKSSEPKGYPGFPVLLVIAIIAGLIFWFVYNKTTYGKYMYAIGGNENAAEVSGVNTVFMKTAIYTVAGVMYAIAGWLLAAKSGGANAGLGTGYELEAIASCTIGGVSATGGIGTVGGILVGVLVFELLKIVLQFLGVNPNLNFVVQGLIIITAVALDIRKYIAKK